MSFSKDDICKKLFENFKKTESSDLVFLYNTEFAKLDNYKLVKMVDDNIVISKSNNIVAKDSFIEHMMQTLRALNRNHFIASIYNLTSTGSKIKYDYEKEVFLVVWHFPINK